MTVIPQIVVTYVPWIIRSGQTSSQTQAGLRALLADRGAVLVSLFIALLVVRKSAPVSLQASCIVSALDQAAVIDASLKDKIHQKRFYQC